MNECAPLRRVDLRVAAEMVESMMTAWSESGIAVHPVVRLGDADERLAVVGVNLARGEARGRVMLFGGGWADLEFWVGDRRSDVLLEIHPVTNDCVVKTVATLFEKVTSAFERSLASDSPN